MKNKRKAKKNTFKAKAPRLNFDRSSQSNLFTNQ